MEPLNNQNLSSAQTEAEKLFWQHHAIIRESDKREYLTSGEKNYLAHKSSSVSLEMLIGYMSNTGNHEPVHFLRSVKQYLDDME